MNGLMCPGGCQTEISLRTSAPQSCMETSSSAAVGYIGQAQLERFQLKVMIKYMLANTCSGKRLN